MTVIFALEDGTPTLKREIGEIYIQRVIDPKNIQKIKDLCLETGSLLKTKELAIAYAKKHKIDFELIEPKVRKIIKKSYADNFTKN